MITISNNKRKSLYKSDIIMNIDFVEEDINKFILNKKAIIINIEDKVKIKSKSFYGININYYNIQFNDEINNKYFNNKMFSKEIFYESLVYKKGNIYDIYSRIKKDNVKICNLIGNNGIINEAEFKEYKHS